MGSGVAMATAVWRACLAKIWISCLFFTLNWIVMLGIEYFCNLEHYCFKKNVFSEFFSWSVTSPMTSYKFRGKLWNLANDVKISYFWLFEFFLLRYFVYLVYFRPFSTEIPQSWLQLAFNECQPLHFSFPSSHISKSYVSLHFKTFIWFGWAKIQVYCLTY